MKKSLFFLMIIAIFYSCKNSEKETKMERKSYADIESRLKIHKENSQKYIDNDNSKKAFKYDDSLKYLIISSYIEKYNFQTIDSSIYNSYDRKKPLFLQVTASWCEPCQFEVQALNKIAEKYNEEVDFVLLFWDNQMETEKLAHNYNKNIVLVPSIKKHSKGKAIDISGFKHFLGFPTNYLITTSNQIINLYGGAMIPVTYTDPNGKEITVTKEEANQINYNNLESEIKELIKKN
jgi:thiol-disulfide isomerase/thioredoxin